MIFECGLGTRWYQGITTIFLRFANWSNIGECTYYLEIQAEVFRGEVYES